MKESQKDQHERIEIYKQFYSSTSKAIDERSQYYSYGIIIGLFSFKEKFFLDHTCIAFVTVLFAILTLILTYVRHLYLYKKSDDVLIENSRYPIKRVSKGIDLVEISYQNFRSYSSFLFKCFQITLFVSIFFFVISAYFNFFAHPCPTLH